MKPQANVRARVLEDATSAEREQGAESGAARAVTRSHRSAKHGGHPRRQLRAARRRSTALAIAGPLFVLLWWQVAATSGWIDARFFPAPSVITRKFVDLLGSGVLQTEVSATAIRVGIGLPLGATIGIVVGLVCGVSQILRAASLPIITAVYSVPKIAVYPLLLMILGLGDKPKIVLVTIAAALIMSIGTIGAVSSIPKELLDAGRAFRASRPAMFLEVIIPASLPQILTSLRIATGMSILAVIATEFVEAEAGVGHLIWNSWVLFQPAQMYVGIACASLLGVLFTGLISQGGRLLTPWDKSSRESRSYF